MDQNTRRRSAKFDKIKDSFFLTRWLQLHCFINVFRSIKRRIQQSDLFNLEKEYWPEENIKKFTRIKEEHRDKGLMGLIFRYFIFWGFIWAGVLIMIGAGLQLVGPLTIKEIVTFLSQDQQNPESKARAEMFAYILLGAYLIRIFIVQYSDRLFFMLSLRVTQVLHYELLSKIARMSFDKKIKTQKIYLANNMMVDCDQVSEAIASSGVLFSLPTTAILVQIFLVIQYEYYALSFMASLLLGLIIQVFIDKKIAYYISQLYSIQYQKYGINCEFVKSFKQVRVLGWQNMIIQKGEQFRKQENRVNSKVYKYKGFFELTGNLIPVVAVLVTLALYSTIHDDRNVDPVVVFTIITYCGMISNINDIYEPLEGYKAFQRISNFLKAQQLRNSSTYDSQMQKGRLQLSHLVARWKFQGVTLQNIEDTMLLQKKQLILDDSSDDDNDQKPLTDQFQKQRQVKIYDLNNSLTQGLLSKQKSEESQLISIKRQRDSHIKSILNKEFTQLQIVHNFHFEKNSLIVVGDVESGKSTFLHLIMGNLSIEQGFAKYGGKIGYMPQNIWFQRASVRSNILFGSHLDTKWLKKVYEWLEIRQEMKLLDNGDQTEINQNLFMTEKQKKKIALARAIYCQPDILILDEPFLFMDCQKAKILYDKICNQFKDKTIIIATKSIEFLNNSDHVLVISSGKIIQSCSYEQIKKNQDSHVHKIIDSGSSKINIVSLSSKQQTILQKKKRTKRIKNLKLKLRLFVKHLLELTHGKTRQQIDQILLQKCGVVPDKTKQKQEEQLKQRLVSVPFGNARKLFVISPIYYVILVVISILIQLVSAYSMYWIGSDEGQLPWDVSYQTQLLVYFILTVIYGIFWSISSLIVPRLSAKVANNLVQQVTKSVAYMQHSKAVKQAYLIPTITLNKANNSYYDLNRAIQNIIYEYITFIVSIILVALSSPIFYAVGAGIGIVYLINQHYLLRVEREIHYLQYLQYPITSIYQQTITGIQTFRAFQRIDQHIKDSIQVLYDQSVYRANHQFIFHGISIICKILGLILLIGAVFFAIQAKGRLSDVSVGLLGVSISFILDLSQILNDIITQSVDLSNILFDTIEDDYNTIDQPVDMRFFTPQKPANWPKDGSIEFKNANISNQIFDEMVIKNLTLKIQSGQQIAIFGSDDMAKLSLIYSLLRYYDNDNPEGYIKIADYQIDLIGRKFLMQEIRILSSDPFSFRGSLRDNIDPFNQHTDKQIIKVLEKTKVWNKLRIKKQDIQDTPFNRLNQLFSDRSRYDILQRINISRALLKNPKIIIATSITDSLNRKSASFLQDLIMTQFSQSTKIFISQNKDTIIKADKVAYFQKSKLKDYGPPLQILNKRYKLTVKKQDQQKIQKQIQIQQNNKQLQKSQMKQNQQQQFKQNNESKNI